MKEPDRRFWPFRPRMSILFSLLLLIILLTAIAILKSTAGWPGEKSETVSLIGILLISLLPVILALLDILIDKGATIEYGKIKLDFSKVQQMGTTGITISANIGVRGEPVNDSSSSKILETLHQAITTNIVIVDLEDGQAWWETRLLVLLAGAERLRKPEKVVFIAKDGGRDQCFQGWGYPDELLSCLLPAHPLYKRILLMARAAANQWSLVEPPYPNVPENNYYPAPALPLAPPGILAQKHQGWMPFNTQTGLPNELFTEQLLQSELGEQIENIEGARSISIIRLNDLFRPVLKKDFIDQNWTQDQQLNFFLNNDSLFVAVTSNSVYAALVSRMTVFNELFKNLTDKKAG